MCSAVCLAYPEKELFVTLAFVFVFYFIQLDKVILSFNLFA